MDEAARCELCGHPLGADGGVDAAGTRLCTPCHNGRFADRLVARGFRLQCLAQAFHAAGEHGGGLTRRVMGALPYELELTANLSPEDWLSKIGKLFKKELQVGDPEFDAAVYVRTDHREALAGALRDPAFRAAVLYAVRTTETAIVIEGNRVELESTAVPVEQVPQALRCVALLLHHLERLALARGLRPQPGRVEYPDLRRTIEHLESARGFGGDNRFWPKGIFLQAATLDDLRGLKRVHDLQADTGRKLELVRLLTTHVVSDDLGPLAELTTLRVLELDDLPAAHRLPPLEALRDLAELSITRCPLTDLAPLAGLERLEELWLRGTPVRDLRPVASLTGLRKLDLRGTAVADLAPLAGLKQLRLLWIEGLDLPAGQVAALRHALPELELDPY
ncbi:MAG: hypothetical protein JXB32_04400 [Deltaproteobacteria bacterium]|nr:hypothetical protein [Deltaproteobacteria bacterium]